MLCVLPSACADCTHLYPATPIGFVRQATATQAVHRNHNICIHFPRHAVIEEACPHTSRLACQSLQHLRQLRLRSCAWGCLSHVCEACGPLQCCLQDLYLEDVVGLKDEHFEAFGRLTQLTALGICEPTNHNVLPGTLQVSSTVAVSLGKYYMILQQVLAAAIIMI